MVQRRLTTILSGVLAVFLMAGASAITSTIEAQAAEADQLLQQLIDGARKEGQMSYFIISSMGNGGARAIEQAFNRRFGLNVKFNTDLSGGESEKFSQALLEVQSGIPPTYDLMQGPEHRVLNLWEKGGVAHMDNWEALLRKISPDAFEVRDRISPLDLAGYGFAFANRVKAINYRTDLISENELPQDHVALGDPKYKGMYMVPKWITEAQYGPLVYPKDKWLKIVASWSQWKPPILHYPVAVQRMMAGEFKFIPSNSYYVFRVKANDPKAPIGVAYFKDFTAVSYVLHGVRKGAKHPNAAKLFALWSTSPEAQRIWENLEYAATPNLMLKRGTGPMSQKVREAVEAKKVKVVTWWDNKESLKMLRWYSTEQGAAYSKALAKAQFGKE